MAQSMYDPSRKGSEPLLPSLIVVQATSFGGGLNMRRLSLTMLCALIALLFSVGLFEHKAEAQTGYASWYSMPGAYTASGQLMTAST